MLLILIGDDIYEHNVIDREVDDLALLFDQPLIREDVSSFKGIIRVGNKAIERPMDGIILP